MDEWFTLIQAAHKLGVHPDIALMWIEDTSAPFIKGNCTHQDKITPVALEEFRKWIKERFGHAES